MPFKKSTAALTTMAFCLVDAIHEKEHSRSTTKVVQVREQRG